MLFQRPLARPLFAALLAAGLAFGPACADESPPTAMAGSESDTGEPEPEPDASLARDIQISQVEVNQGVAIPVVRDGTWVPIEARNAPLLSGRDTLVRLYWEREPEFTERELLARLTLIDPEGGELVFEQTRMIDDPAYPHQLDGTFSIGVPAAAVVPGLEFRASLHEVDPAYLELPLPELEPLSPADGEFAPLGLTADPMHMDVVLVPMIMDTDECQANPPIEMALPDLESSLIGKYPIQSLSIRVRETPVVVTSYPEQLWDLIPLVQEARADDAPDPASYYFGLIYPCAIGVAGQGGIAYADDVPASPDADWQRVAIGVIAPSLPSVWFDFVISHELGHVHGLRHVTCPFPSDNPDPDYPHAEGTIGVWGFDIGSFELLHPTTNYDYMSYCNEDVWASDWTWAKTFERVRELSSWSADTSAGRPEGTLLLGIIPDDPAATPRWWTLPGTVPDEDRQRAPLRARVHGLGVELDGSHHRLPDAQAEVVALELPPQLALDLRTLDGQTLDWARGHGTLQPGPQVRLPH